MTERTAGTVGDEISELDNLPVTGAGATITNLCEALQFYFR